MVHRRSLNNTRMFKNARIVKSGANPLEYFGQSFERGTADYVMSVSALRNFGQSPSRFLAGFNPPDSEAKEWGRLLDTMILSPEQFVNRYAIQPAEYESDSGPKPWNGNAKVCRAWKDEILSENKEVVTKADVELCGAACDRLRSDDILNSFLSSCDTQVWVRADWEDEATGLSIPFQALIDLVPRLDTEWAKNLGDLKTTKNAAPIPWTKWCWQAGYHIQAAAYRDIYCAATGEDRPSFVFLLVENFPPWEPGRRLMSQDFMDLGTAAYKRLLSGYCQCLKSGKYPAWDDSDESVQGWTLVAPTPWMATEEQFAPHFQFEEEDQP